MSSRSSSYSWEPRGIQSPSTTVTSLRGSLCGQQGSVRERHCQAFKLTLFSILPGVILIIRNTMSLADNVQILKANDYFKQNVRFSMEIGDVIHRLQIERGTTALYVSSKGDTFVKNRLNSLYRKTDASIESLSQWPRGIDAEHFTSRQTLHAEIRRFREELDPFNATLDDIIRFYTDINALLIQGIDDIINGDNAVIYWTDLVAYQSLLMSKEQAGIERALGSTFYARGQFPLQDLLWYIEKRVLGESFLDQTTIYSDRARTLLDRLYANSTLSQQLDAMRDTISVNERMNASALAGALWFDNMTEYINILKIMHDDIAVKIIQSTTDESEGLEDKLVTSVLELVVAVFLAAGVILHIHNILGILRKMQLTGAELKNKTLDLEQERKRTEGLLFQLLPRTVATKLMNHGHAIPEAYQSATIMFSDVVGFTRISSHSTPMQVVDMLNKLYMTIDSRLENFDVYKVETIGDGYMVASGLPNSNGDRHVGEIANLSLDLLKTVQLMTIPHMASEQMRLRIGFNTGPCAAGVVGIKMPRYCIFGDTVNTASRMESTGLPLKIQISEKSASLLKKRDSQYHIAERGILEIKGKGSMRTFWLNGYERETISTMPAAESKYAELTQKQNEVESPLSGFQDSEKIASESDVFVGSPLNQSNSIKESRGRHYKVAPLTTSGAGQTTSIANHTLIFVQENHEECI